MNAVVDKYGTVSRQGNLCRQRPVYRQRGVSLVTALFLIVVLAGIASFAVRLTAVQQQSFGAGLQATRALLAARAGVEWGAHRALNGGSCVSQSTTLNEAGAAGFTISVTCAQSVHSEGGATVNVYTIEALAQAGTYGGPDYVSRRLHATITDAG